MKTCLLSAVIGLAVVASAGQTYAATSTSACSENDITALNYALTLEHLESSFYNNFQNKYTAADFTAAGYDKYAFPNFALIQAHEKAHVTVLTQTISGRGGAAVPACIYNFSSIDSVQAYIAVAQVLENTGVAAYDGAINTFTDPALEQAAATIATIEARHAAYLNQLNQVSPFPYAFNNATTPTVVVAEVLKTGLIVSCPYNLTTPVVLVPTAQTGIASASNSSNAHPLTTEQGANDLLALNYALTLEHLESHFYTLFQSVYTAANFSAAGFGQDVYDEFNMIASHEQAHVSALTTTIQSLGGTAVPECTYNFSSINSVKSYIAVAKVLENTGVSAYDGAVNTISSTQLSQIAATIATVEARHAAVLNALNGVAPFPSDLDTAIAPTDIISAVLATGFVLNCPYNLTGPVILSSKGDCNVSDSSNTGSVASGASVTPILPAPSSGTGSIGVCPSVNYTPSYARTSNDFTVTFTLNSSDQAAVGVQWVDLHVSINTPFGVDPTTGAYLTQFNYRMAKQSTTVFTYTFPGTDGVTIPSADYVEYFFTYFTTFACNGGAGTLAKDTTSTALGVTLTTSLSKADAATASSQSGCASTVGNATIMTLGVLAVWMCNVLFNESG